MLLGTNMLILEDYVLYDYMYVCMYAGSDLLLYMQKKNLLFKTYTSAVELRILEEAVVRVCLWV